MACIPTVTRWPASCFLKLRITRRIRYVNELKGKVGNELMRRTRAIGRRSSGWWMANASRRWPILPGGGITDNLPRVLPRGVAAVIEMGSWPVLPMLRTLAEAGQCPERRNAADVQHGDWDAARRTVEEVQEGTDGAGASWGKSLYRG